MIPAILFEQFLTGEVYMVAYFKLCVQSRHVSTIYVCVKLCLVFYPSYAIWPFLSSVCMPCRFLLSAAGFPPKFYLHSERKASHSYIHLHTASVSVVAPFHHYSEKHPLHVSCGCIDTEDHNVRNHRPAYLRISAA